MNDITKNLLLGYIFIMLLGGGCFGFVFMNFFNDINAVVTATCATSLLLLVAYLIVAIVIVYLRKSLSQGTQNAKWFLTLLITLSLVTVILTVLFFMFRDFILVFFTEEPRILRSGISILFLISIAIVILRWFKARK